MVNIILLFPFPIIRRFSQVITSSLKTFFDGRYSNQTLWNILVVFQLFAFIKSFTVNISRHKTFLYPSHFSSCKPKVHRHNKTVAINEVMSTTIGKFP